MRENAQPIADVPCSLSYQPDHVFLRRWSPNARERAAHRRRADVCMPCRLPALAQVAALMRENAQPIADVLVKEVAKPAVDAYTGEPSIRRHSSPHVCCSACLCPRPLTSLPVRAPKTMFLPACRSCRGGALCRPDQLHRGGGPALLWRGESLLTDTQLDWRRADLLRGIVRCCTCAPLARQAAALLGLADVRVWQAFPQCPACRWHDWVRLADASHPAILCPHPTCTDWYGSVV